MSIASFAIARPDPRQPNLGQSPNRAERGEVVGLNGIAALLTTQPAGRAHPATAPTLRRNVAWHQCNTLPKLASARIRLRMISFSLGSDCAVKPA